MISYHALNETDIKISCRNVFLVQEFLVRKDILNEIGVWLGTSMVPAKFDAALLMPILPLVCLFSIAAVFALFLNSLNPQILVDWVINSVLALRIRTV